MKLLRPINVGLLGIGTVGGGTFTAWKRRSSERSFSIDFRYSDGVVAPAPATWATAKVASSQ